MILKNLFALVEGSSAVGEVGMPGVPLRDGIRVEDVTDHLSPVVHWSYAQSFAKLHDIRSVESVRVR